MAEFHQELSSRGGARPFSSYEWLIAYRYLKSRRSEGGVSVMTVISVIGIAIAVFALVATLSVRTGFRSEFMATVLGANAHVSIYSGIYAAAAGGRSTAIQDYDSLVESLGQVDGVVRASPVLRAQLLATSEIRNAGVQMFGIRPADFIQLPLIADPESSIGQVEDFGAGIAVGTGVARELGITVGDSIRLISPQGVKTAFGTVPRISSYPVSYIFGVGRSDIDRVRIYLPFDEAQIYLNREGTADEIEIFVEDPEVIEEIEADLLAVAGDQFYAWSWKDSSGAFLRALQMEDNVMFIILSILVLIATSNIVSGLVMLVRNKGRDIGILRTIGLSQGTVMRIFFICGASIGIIGTIIGVVLGCVFAYNIDPIFELVNMMAGGGVWDPNVRFLSSLPAKVEMRDVLSAVVLSLSLSFVVTIFPARRASRMNPLDALRYE
ncbi:MAG: lipoprotein-releasing ABC transporter permease subunit [Rhodobacteraceae bacterium]|nr:lipoprotein-releasing ABC transporter permease subunit [Paracoccaceae bacterium]MCY4195713.1 lipoprotein-releasing ABC transporter permease subunit [Paracoccaceae bacterium]